MMQLYTLFDLDAFVVYDITWKALVISHRIITGGKRTNVCYVSVSEDLVVDVGRELLLGKGKWNE